MATTISKLKAILDLDNSKFKKGLNDSQQQTKSFGSSIGKLGVAMAAAFSVGIVANWLKASVEAYDVQIKAERLLFVAMDKRSSLQRLLILQAQELQNTTLYGDEATIQAQSMLATLGLTFTEIRAIMPLVQDFSTAFGVGLKDAASLIGKSIGSSTNALSRYGIAIEGAVGSTERFSSAYEVLLEMVGGQAEGAAGVGTGDIVQAGNAWGDFGEQIGELALGLVTLNGALPDAFTEWIKEVTLYLRIFNRDATLISDLAIKSITEEFGLNDVTDLQQAIGLYEELKQKMLDLYATQKSASGEFADGRKFTAFPNMDEDTKNEISKIQGALSILKDIIGDLTPEAEEAIGKLAALRVELKELRVAREGAFTTKEINKYTVEIKRVQAEINNLIGNIKNLKDAKPFEFADPKLGDISVLKNHISILKTYRDEVAMAGDEMKILAFRIAEAEFELTKLQNPLEQMEGGFSTVGLTLDEIAMAFAEIGLKVAMATMGISGFSEAMKQLQDVTVAAGPLVAQGISLIANSAAIAFSGDGEAALENFLRGLGGLMQQYGALLVAKGLADQALKVGGATAIAAGAALIVIGAAITQSQNKIGAYGSTGGGYYGSSGNTFTTGYYTENREIFLVARGPDLVAVLNRQNDIDYNNGP